MKNIRKILRPAAALLLSLAAAGAMAGSQSVSVSIIGPGGHSNGDYGNVNAVHAAARSIMLIEKSVPDAVHGRQLRQLDRSLRQLPRPS